MHQISYEDIYDYVKLKKYEEDQAKVGFSLPEQRKCLKGLCDYKGCKYMIIMKM